ncbi:hypothetical protein RMCBS344292_11928 [Rhizopus microsporus]|nr:hypothetical protein RMCBS344292_11928 [Rhizopus microsporus]
MSSRALRRLQKEQLLIPKHDSDEEGEEEEVVVETTSRKQLNPFDLLNEGDDEEEEEEEEEEEQQEEYKLLEKPVHKESTPSAPKPSSKSSKKKKKNKKNKKTNDTTSNQKGKEVEDISMRELEKVIKEMNKKSPGSASPHQDTHIDIYRQLLSVNTRFLDAEAEMKRLFGSHVVNSEHRGRVLKKSKFTTPKPEWPPYKRNGLSMEIVETVNGVTYFAFRHSEAYQDNQLEFLNAVATHNPEALIFLVRRHPYHVDTLLQLSEIAKHSGDWVAAGDFIERALYACERALHPQFALGSGTVRLSYQRSENRSFFLAIFRHIQFLARRGCWRTAFEFNKLLFALDPEHDPLASLLTLDHYALIAKDYEYVLKMYHEWKNRRELYPADLSNMPNFAFSAAYAQFKLPNESSNELIQHAIAKFPTAYQLLLEKLDKGNEADKGQSSMFLNALQTIYAERAYELFKEPEVLEWLVNSSQKRTEAEHKFSEKDVKCDANQELPINVARFLLLDNNQRLLSLVPHKYTSQSYQMHDPLPPEDSVTMYDINERMRSSGNRFMSPFPTDARGLMNALQEMWRQGQGRLPPEALQQVRQLMNELGQIEQQQGDQLPGTFPEDNDQDNEEEEEEDSDLRQLENEM